MKFESKRKVKSAYLKAKIGISDALTALMFDFGMDRGPALSYLGL